MNTWHSSQENELPVKYPIITTYCEIANLLSVIQCHDDSLPWILNNYIQLYFMEFTGIVDPPEFYQLNNFENCPCIDYQRIGRDLVSKKWGSFIEFVKDSIDLGYYIYIFLDNYYITKSFRYQKEHFFHPTLIYGCDLLKDTINVADFYRGGKYIYTKENCTNIELSYNNDNQNECVPFYGSRFLCDHDIILYKYRKDFIFNFDVKLVISLLEDYVSSTNTYEKAGMRDYQRFSNGKCVFGISVYDEIENRLVNQVPQLGFIDVRLFYTLLDHKVLMLTRIKYLGDNGYLKDISSIYDCFSDIEIETRKLLNLTIKYNICKDQDVLKGIISDIPLMIEKEKKAFELLISELKKNI